RRPLWQCAPRAGAADLVTRKIGALHIIKGAEEIGHSRRHTLHILVCFGTGPVLLITFPRRIEFGIRRIEFRIGKFALVMAARAGVAAANARPPAQEAAARSARRESPGVTVSLESLSDMANPLL